MQLKCRKCNGSHLTIKCGIVASNKVTNIVEDKTNIVENIIEKKTNINSNKPNNKPNYYNTSYNNPYNKNQRKTFKVKISELPNDLTENELMELLYDWGDIIYLKVINYDTNSLFSRILIM